MLDYYNVKPDHYRLMNKNFTVGRRGGSPKYIVRHHLAGVGDGNTVWGWWQTRPASAHYVIDPKGKAWQLVRDRDMAWANANTEANMNAISIEHSNDGGKDFSINTKTIIEGARVAAAACYYYKMGRPKYGVNIFDHRKYTSTDCPKHLAFGGKYHLQWMDEAQRFYDLLVAKKVTPAGELVGVKNASNTTTTQGGLTVSDVTKILTEINSIKATVRDNHIQLTGDAEIWPGFELRWLINAAKERGWKRMTAVEMQACLLAATEEERAAIKEANKPVAA